jgi:hypothetical protein
MKDESRTMWVVLLVCGFVMCGCIVLPLGLGAAFFMGISRQQAVLAEKSRAEAVKVQTQLEQVAPAVVPPVATPPELPPALGTIDATDPAQRKLIYQALKAQREVAQQLEQSLAQLATASDDPTLKQALDGMKLEQDKAIDEIAKQWKVTRQQLDEIVAEGDKAGW